MSRLSGVGSGKSNSRPGSKDGQAKNIWSSMLDGVASGKRLPEKQILVLGGTPESQRDFLETLSTEPSNPRLPTDRRRGKAPPIANQFALGYTYQDVLDADQEDTLARLSIYLLSEPAPSFAPLLKPLITPKSAPNTLIVLLLDWSDPWKWPRQLRQWIRLLRSVLITLDDETKVVMEEVMTDWRERRRGGDSSTTTGGPNASGSGVLIPLGPGEWDEGLGLPICVVCQSSNKIDNMEKEYGWREEEFDFVLQFMRTVLLKHGASLIYTTPFQPSSIQSLIHSSLGIHSLLKRQSLKHNVIDRDKILVPPNWDSWGKIRILREGFDMEGIGAAWSVEIQAPPDPVLGNTDANPSAEDLEDGSSAVAIYEQTIQDPKQDRVGSQNGHAKGPRIQVETLDTQIFLGEQAEVLERMKAEDERAQTRARKGAPAPTGSGIEADERGRMDEHIGPVQTNVGGIQVDADDMLKRLKEREASRTPRKDAKGDAETPDGKAQNADLANFFANLMKKGRDSPRTPAAEKT